MTAMDWTEQPHGVRDCAFRDPAGSLIRVQELRLSRPEEVLRNG
jgi:hypothetical protein